MGRGMTRANLFIRIFETGEEAAVLPPSGIFTQFQEPVPAPHFYIFLNHIAAYRSLTSFHEFPYKFII